MPSALEPPARRSSLISSVMRSSRWSAPSEFIGSPRCASQHAAYSQLPICAVASIAPRPDFTASKRCSCPLLCISESILSAMTGIRANSAAARPKWPYEPSTISSALSRETPSIFAQRSCASETFLWEKRPTREPSAPPSATALSCGRAQTSFLNVLSECHIKG